MSATVARSKPSVVSLPISSKVSRGFPVSVTKPSSSCASLSCWPATVVRKVLVWSAVAASLKAVRSASWRPSRGGQPAETARAVERERLGSMSLNGTETGWALVFLVLAS